MNANEVFLNLNDLRDAMKSEQEDDPDAWRILAALYSEVGAESNADNCRRRAEWLESREKE